jgi:CubicO group peptidase (beta-lactamase class C family)
MRRLTVVLFACLSFTAHASGLPTDSEIHRILEDRVQAIAGPEGGMGIVVGVLDEKGPRVIAYGDGLNGDSVFEIASVTKVFTALLLVDMTRTRDLALNDPVIKYLPKGTKLPERNGRKITLVDLATHTSGLPFMPDGAEFYPFLATYALPRDIGAEWDYSNLGYWLLQEAMSRRDRADFEQLLQKRVIVPLGLHSTAITWTPELKARAAIGHDASLQPAPTFASTPIYNLMPAAGGMLSTPNDLLKFLGIAMGYEDSKLAPTIAKTLQTRRPAGSNEQALGWLIAGTGEDQIVFHDGGSFGYSSSVVWQPQRRIGVVVLSNQTTNVGDIARHLLQPSSPLEQPGRVRHTEIKLDPSTLDRYVGRYDMQGEGIVTIAREEQLLTIELPPSWGLPKLKLHAEGERDFYATELPLRVKFEVEEGGGVKGMQVQPPRGQKTIPAVRLKPDPLR